MKVHIFSFYVFHAIASRTVTICDKNRFQNITMSELQTCNEKDYMMDY